MPYLEQSDAPAARPPKPRADKRVAGWLLVAVMALGSIFVWLVSPVMWLWIASRMQEGSQPSMGPYAVVMIGLLFTTVLAAKGLSALNRLHIRVTATEVDERRQTPWLRSMRGERPTTSKHGVLDVVMLWSVGVALVCAAVWFFAFAGSSLPTP